MPPRPRTPELPAPDPEKTGRVQLRRGQGLMQRRAAAAVMALREGRSDDERQLLALAADAVLKLAVRD